MTKSSALSQHQPALRIFSLRLRVSTKAQTRVKTTSALTWTSTTQNQPQEFTTDLTLCYSPTPVVFPLRIWSFISSSHNPRSYKSLCQRRKTTKTPLQPQESDSHRSKTNPPRCPKYVLLPQPELEHNHPESLLGDYPSEPQISSHSKY